MINSEHNDKQAEFFSNLPSFSSKPKRKKINLGRIALSLSYENIIILTIGLIMLLIVCYSFGVERGKYLAQHKFVEKDIAKIKQQPGTNKQEQSQKIETKKPSKPNLNAPGSSKYTIQVGCFRKATSINKAIKGLKSIGMHPFVIQQGILDSVCVGSYNNKSEADADLKKIRKLYSDSYVRLLQENYLRQ